MMNIIQSHEMILETDADDTQCSKQLADVSVPQIANIIVEVVTAFHRSESQNESLYRSSKILNLPQQVTHRMRRVSQDRIQQRTGEQVVNKHVQQVEDTSMRRSIT